MIGQGRGVTQDDLRKVMERLTTPTGGRAFFTDSIDELHDTFKDLLDELSNQYLVGYQPTNTSRDSKWREIRVEVDGHPNVRARQGYRAVPLQMIMGRAGRFVASSLGRLAFGLTLITAHGPCATAAVAALSVVGRGDVG